MISSGPTRSKVELLNSTKMLIDNGYQIFATSGTAKFFEENGCITPCDIHMIIHEPIETAGLDRKAEKELHSKVEAIILDGLRELGAIE